MATSNHVEDELVRKYLAEYSLSATKLRADLVAIVKNSKDLDLQLVNGIRFAVHAIRGLGFLGLLKISELAEQMENVLAQVCSKGVVPGPYQLRILLLAMERLEELTQNYRTSNEADTVAIIAALFKLQIGSPTHADDNVADSTDPERASERRLRSLVVDDDLASRLLLKTFLSRFGESNVACNGIEAVEKFRSAFERGQKYDLVCMDINMPEMDGHEAIRQLRLLEEANGLFSNHGAKIAMLTSVDDIREVIQCFQEFSDLYLVKPINLVSLLRQMKSWQLIPA